MPDSPPIPSEPQIRQDVKGDRNQVIAQAIDSTIVEFAGDGQVINMTIHERVPERFVPSSISDLQPLSQQEYRQQQVLLNKVKEYWIKGVLETSLHARVLIELGLQKRLDLAERPFSEVAEFPDTFGQALPSGTAAINIFDQMDAGRTLLILGEPGSGKTITLLKLAEDLIARTEADLSQPIPVVFNLSSWARKPKAIEEWLIQELDKKYKVPKSLGKSWVEKESLILLLDGLDEVKDEQRNACLQALNQFMQTHGVTELTICCRIGEYQALSSRLTLRSVICIQPLTSKQVNTYFELAGERLSALKAVVQQDGRLQELTTSPLLLSIMSLAYEGCETEEISLDSRTEDYRHRLFDTYIERMFYRRETTQQYPRKESQRWLSWLAQRMNISAQTMFLIERLQPSCLPTRKERFFYRLESGFIFGLSTLIMNSLINGLISGLVFRLISSLITGLKGGLIVGLFGGLMVGLTIAFMEDIKPIETLKWSWQEFRNNFKNGLIFGAIIAIITSFYNDLSIALFFGMINGLIVSLIGGFRGPEILQKDKPNQGIFKSALNAVTLGIFVSAIYMLIYGLIYHQFYRQIDGLFGGRLFGLCAGLSSALTIGLIIILVSGGSASLRHIALRFMLYRKGYAPWDYSCFLDYATERLFLQKVGGGYIFMHRMLLEHFAEMPLEQGQR
jgi:NACHT domain